MATRRTTHDKRQRERNKQQKAAAKRARRQGERLPDDPEFDEAVSLDDGPESTEQLLQEMEALHADYDAGRVSFEDFEERKSALMDRIAVRLAQ